MDISYEIETKLIYFINVVRTSLCLKFTFNFSRYKGKLDANEGVYRLCKFFV